MGTWVIAGGCEEWGWVGCTLEGWQDRSWQMKVNTAVLAVNKTNAPFLADLCWIAKHFMIKQIPMIWNLNTQLVCYSDPHCIMCARKTDVITSLVSGRSHSLHNCSHFNAFFCSNLFSDSWKHQVQWWNEERAFLQVPQKARNLPCILQGSSR